MTKAHWLGFGGAMSAWLISHAFFDLPDPRLGQLYVGICLMILVLRAEHWK